MPNKDCMRTWSLQTEPPSYDTGWRPLRGPIATQLVTAGTCPFFCDSHTHSTECLLQVAAPPLPACDFSRMDSKSTQRTTLYRSSYRSKLTQQPSVTGILEDCETRISHFSLRPQRCSAVEGRREILLFVICPVSWNVNECLLLTVYSLSHSLMTAGDK